MYGVVGFNSRVLQGVLLKLISHGLLRYLEQYIPVRTDTFLCEGVLGDLPFAVLYLLGVSRDCLVCEL